ncbi:hypothetical protein GGS20DRAFT_527717 [Poronia punctata]|nr:hypothetical protein GGS20DRAFT_527717 [Poronia punctata]
MPQSTGFQFITSINTVAHDEETRRKVRSHARRQKLPNETSSPPQPKKSTTQKERISKFRLKPSVQGSEVGAKVTGASKSSANGGKKRPPPGPQFHGPVVRASAGDQSDGANLTPTMLSHELGLVVARELPNFPMLRIETTPLTENLLKYCFTVCLCPREAVVEKWFDRAGAPTYMMTYYSGFLANAFAMNPEGNFFDALHVDTAITHAFMALVASMHNALARWDDTSTFDFHRLQAIKAINERLDIEGKSPSIPISDGITMAVALLVNNETFTGSIQAAAAHMSGLKRIVDMRGGIVEGFKYATVIQRALVWADFSYAYASRQPLMFPFVPQLATSLWLHNRFGSRWPGAVSEHTGTQSLSIRNRKLLDIFELLYSITVCLGSFDYANLADMSAERVGVSDSIYLTEWNLFQLEESLTPPRTSEDRGDVGGSLGDPSTVDLSESLMYAAHLFMHLALRGQPPSAPRHRAMTEALVSSLWSTRAILDLLPSSEVYGSPISHHSGGSLGDSSVEDWSTTTSSTSVLSIYPVKLVDEFTHNILLWTLFVGACVRVTPIVPEPHQSGILGDHHQFFIHALVNYCRKRRISDKKTLETKIKDIIWLDSWCENQLDMIWGEIGDCLMP